MKRTICWLLLATPLGAQAQFDHGHAAWSVLLKRHVVVAEGGNASQVDYAGFVRDRAVLKSYLDSLSRVTEAEFGAWSKPQRMAFLINAYNAWTVEKILTRYPRIKSIRDFGLVFGNPWRDRFFTLFGRETHLDGIEHEMLRSPGAYDEPRVHFAVNCASIGCPMLREEAYVAGRLDGQLDEQAQRFLSDRSRNRYDAPSNALEVSKIFDWYKIDWSSGYRGFAGNAPPIVSLPEYFSRNARLLASDPAEQRLLAEGKVKMRYLDYDWALNDIRR